MRGEWIEIVAMCTRRKGSGGSLPMRGEWIEILPIISADPANRSLPMRGEWIEIRRD